MSSTKHIWTMACAGAGRAAVDLTIGALRIGSRYADMSNIRLVAIADIDFKRAKSVAKTHKIPSAFSDVDIMLRETKPDILVINTPVRFHYENALSAIRNGTHFILEKPATSTAEQLTTIMRAAEKKHVKGSVVHNYKWMPGFQKAYCWFMEGRLGTILHAERVWMTPANRDRMEMDRNGWWHALPGGRIADSLPHHLYVIYPFMGDLAVERVLVRKRAKDRPWSKCDEADILLSAQGGYANIRLSTNMESWPNGKGSCPYNLILYGTKEAVVVYQHDAYILRKPHPTYLISQAAQDVKRHVVMRARMRLGNPPNSVYRGAHNVYFREFIKYLEGCAPNPTPWAEAIAVMRLTEEISAKMENALHKRHATR